MTNPDEIVEAIEAAEEAKEVAKIVEYVELASSHGGDEDWAEAAEASAAPGKTAQSRARCGPPLPRAASPGTCARG